MRIKYNVKQANSSYDVDKFFTFGKEYDVMADYRKRQSGQKISDNGFVMIDNQGKENMLFMNEVEISCTDIENTFVFDYK